MEFRCPDGTVHVPTAQEHAERFLGVADQFPFPNNVCGVFSVWVIIYPSDGDGAQQVMKASSNAYGADIASIITKLKELCFDSGMKLINSRQKVVRVPKRPRPVTLEPKASLSLTCHIHDVADAAEQFAVSEPDLMQHRVAGTVFRVPFSYFRKEASLSGTVGDDIYYTELTARDLMVNMEMIIGTIESRMSELDVEEEQRQLLWPDHLKLVKDCRKIIRLLRAAIQC